MEALWQTLRQTVVALVLFFVLTANFWRCFTAGDGKHLSLNLLGEICICLTHRESRQCVYERSGKLAQLIFKPSFQVGVAIGSCSIIIACVIRSKLISEVRQ